MNAATARRMIGAEVLKLRRNRGVMAFAIVLMIGVVVLFYGISAIEHASDPLRNRAAGGFPGFQDGVRALGDFFGMLAAILIGAEAGTADRASGVFRDLVVTGRSRLALFAVRAPAAILVWLSLAAVSFGLIVVATFVFAPSVPGDVIGPPGVGATPSLGLILRSAGWVALDGAVLVACTVGIGSLTGSRALTLTAAIGWEAIASSLLLNASLFGSARRGLLNVALDNLIPIPGSRPDVTMADGLAVIVLIVWVALAIALGAWGTQTVDA